MLVIVVGVGWKCTPRGHEPCHLLFNLGDHSTAWNDIHLEPATRSRSNPRNQWVGGELQISCFSHLCYVCARMESKLLGKIAEIFQSKHQTFVSYKWMLCHMRPVIGILQRLFFAHHFFCLTWRKSTILAIADKYRLISGGSRGGAMDARPPGPKFLHFHAVFGKNWPNNRLAPPPLGLAPPPLGNPGSATGFCTRCGKYIQT